jgi:hypothetical protein
LRTCQALADDQDANQAKTKIKYGGAEEQLSGVNGEAARAAQRVEPQKNQGHQNPVQIKDREHAPNHGGVTVGAVVNASIKLAIQIRYIPRLCAAVKLNSE